MAKPIKTTPILRSNDAVNFYRKLEDNKDSKISKERLLEIRKTATEFRSILKK